MYIHAHLEKYRHIDTGLRRPEVIDCPELWLWGAQNALTHLYNASLHCAKVTRQYSTFPKQMVGVFVCTDSWNVSQNSILQSDADALHTDLPKIDAHIPPELLAPIRILRHIEINAGEICRTSQVISKVEFKENREAYRVCASSFLEYLALKDED